jgi:hypothetical protein
MAGKRPSATSSAAAGLSGGTGFAGLVSLLPDNTIKSVLLILAPSITVIIGLFWKVATDELGAWLADWKLRREARGAEALCRRLEANPNASAELKAQAEATLKAVMQTEVLFRKQRADSILREQ